MYKTIFLVLLLGVCFFQLAISGPAVVKTTEGRYRGTTFPTGARAFLGIPFAQPPLGKLRWKRAKPAKSFNGIKEATVSGACCPQSGIFKNLTVAESEDCLTLDIYAPKEARAGDNLQVKVYIHGGGFQANSAVLYPGDQLAVNTSSVVVVINYRLSYQGFMVFTPLINEEKGVLNYGITDQQLALKWIQRNIRKFGGDKKNVMIFGNSAGGLSVLLHYTLPGSKNLFKVGVSESAGPWNLISAATAASYNDPLAARFGCYSTTTGVNMTCLREVPYAKIYNYTWAASQPTYDNLIKNPVDVTFGSKQLLKKAKANNPLMVGYANYEGNQFAWLALRIFTKNPHPALNASFPLFFGILNATLPFTQDIIQNVANYYANLSVNGNYYIPLREALGDYGIKCGIARTAYNALTGLGKNNVYNFFFQHDTADWRYTFLNATHTVEVPYLFLTNGTIAETKFTPEEVRLARRLVKYIGNFQDTRNPNEEPGNRDPALPNVNNLPNWPKFKKDKASTLAWDLTSDVITLPVPAPCKIYWDNLIINSPFRGRSAGKNNVDFDKFFSDPKAMELKSMFH